MNRSGRPFTPDARWDCLEGLPWEQPEGIPRDTDRSATAEMQVIDENDQSTLDGRFVRN